MAQSPDTRGYFVGDYEGLSNDGDDFAPFIGRCFDAPPRPC